ncbi:MAG: tyrosine-type recombinase/integrase [Candidatus Bathyarchaeota archaeon]
MEYRMVSTKRAPWLPPWIRGFAASLHLKKMTRYRYRHAVLEFARYVKKTLGKRNFSPADVTQKIIINWVKKTGQNYSPRSVVYKISILSLFFSFLEKTGRLKKNPLKELRKKYPKYGLNGIVRALLGPSPQKSLQALKVSKFTSLWGEQMKNFIALGRAQGKMYRSEEYILWRFDRFLGDYRPPPKQLSDSITRKWLNLFSECRAGYRYKNFRVVRHFCLYLRRFDSTAYVPDPSLRPELSSKYIPYIYSRTEFATILKTACKLKPTAQSPLRPHIFYVLILLLYTTGMRLGEVLNLRLRDIDRRERILYLRRTKFYKARYIPLSTSMMKELEDYLESRRFKTPTSPESYLFHNPYRGKPYSIMTIQDTFVDILRNLGFKPPEGQIGPNIHHLRATFATHRMEEWYRQGVDVQSKMGLLSTYMGHINIASTQRYLPMTTELLGHASQLFEKYFKSTNGEKKR